MTDKNMLQYSNLVSHKSRALRLRPSLPSMIQVWSLLDVVRRLKKSSVIIETLLEKCHINPKFLEERDLLIPLKNYIEFLELAAQETRDMNLGIHVGLKRDLRDLQLYGFIMLSAATVKESLQQGIKYMAIYEQGAEVCLEHDDKKASFTYQVLDQFYWPRRQDTELVLAQVVSDIRTYAGSNWMPIEVHFEHRATKRSQTTQARFWPQPPFSQTNKQDCLRCRDIGHRTAAS